MHTRLSDVMYDDAYLEIRGIGPRFHLKLEWLNPAGSIKIKTALGLLDDLQERGLIGPDTRLIESSSGNLGLALAALCAERGLHFTCVVDPNCAEHNIRAMRALGAEIAQVRELDSNGGFLGTRIAYIKGLVARDPRYLWLNQYENPANPRVHARTTALSIVRRFGHVDYLFVGAGTTGTLMGCIQYFGKHHPNTRIVAVDSEGSVTFGTPAGKRYIPGIGTSRTPPILDPQAPVFALELVPEAATIAMCRHLARTRGLLLGGSSGTVAAAVHAWRDRIPEGATVVALSPDGGERYLDTVYDDAWVEKRFGAEPILAGLDQLRETPSTTRYFESAPDPAVPRFHVVDGKTVAAILDEDPARCFVDVERAYLAHDAGLTVNPDSYFLRFPQQPSNRIIALPASVDTDDPVRGIKWISSYPGNVAAGMQRASAVLILNDARTGYAFACIEASRISAARTAASAVLAARWLRPDAPTGRHIPRLSFVGAGFIARTVLDYFAFDGWTADAIEVHDRHPESAAALGDHARRRRGFSKVRETDLPTALSADVVVLATTAPAPYIDHRFEPHQLVLNISLRDLTPAVIAAANNVLDDVEHCLKANTSPDLAVREFGRRDFINGTLAQRIRGQVALDRDRPVIFSPFGLGVLDLVVGKRVYDEAVRQGLAKPHPNFFFETNRW